MSSSFNLDADQSFEPLLGESARILILGSLPGKRSIAEQGYYAHPRNAFWPIMSELLGFELNLPYTDRIARLHEHRIALWDVVASAQRPGSLDSAIVRRSARYNDIPALLKRSPAIELIGFNGNAAADLFKRAQKEWQTPLREVSQVRLPSTSPAHAALSKQQKLAAWRSALETLL